MTFEGGHKVIIGADLNSCMCFWGGRELQVLEKADMGSLILEGFFGFMKEAGFTSPLK